MPLRSQLGLSQSAAHRILGPRCEGSARTFLLFFPSGSSTCSTSALVWKPIQFVEPSLSCGLRGAALGSAARLGATCCLPFPASGCCFDGSRAAGLDCTFCCIEQERSHLLSDRIRMWAIFNRGGALWELGKGRKHCPPQRETLQRSESK